MLNVIITSTKSPKYPKLMVTSKGKVVLFSSKTDGTIVFNGSGHSISSTHIVGYHTDCWAPEDFTDFRGSVKLTNATEEG